MNREDIIRMAREAGLTVGTNISGVTLVGSPSTPGIAHIDIDEMQRFAALVAAAEREACAKVCDEQKDRSLAARDKSKRVTDGRIYHAAAQTAAWNAAAIRARGKA